MLANSDGTLTGAHKQGPLAVPYKLVAQTWEHTILHEDKLPENWIQMRDVRVLVSIEPSNQTRSVITLLQTETLTELTEAPGSESHMTVYLDYMCKGVSFVVALVNLRIFWWHIFKRINIGLSGPCSYSSEVALILW